MTTDWTQASLEQLTQRGRALLDEHDPTYAHTEFHYWESAVAWWLDKHLPDSGRSATWSGLPTSHLLIGGQYYDDASAWLQFRNAVQTRLRWLGEVAPTVLSHARAAIKGSAVGVSKRVFVVHGRDIAAREAAARLIERLGLEAVILHEQPNKGRTIIEKFESYADVGFAVVLLTPDDLVMPRNGSNEQARSRARQNVILELGYFLGALGRERVCALYKDDVEIPSDYSGVLFVALDANGAWKLLLAKEMKAAGIAVDLNLVL